MGLKYDAHQFKRAGDRLNNSQKAFKRYLIRDMEKLARLVERLARAMAPLETGSLESAIFARVVKEGYTGLRIELSVSGAKPREGNPGVEVGDYAEYMELGKYRLGYLHKVRRVRVQLLRKNLKQTQKRQKKRQQSQHLWRRLKHRRQPHQRPVPLHLRMRLNYQRLTLHRVQTRQHHQLQKLQIHVRQQKHQRQTQKRLKLLPNRVHCLQTVRNLRQKRQRARPQ